MHDFIKICKRVNNKKRNYLVLNKLQCKHYPSNPAVALNQFRQLADKVSNKYAGKILVIGFAETATAIGLEVASSLNKCTGIDADYIQTTRESTITEFYKFSEEHSHATEQKLALDDFSGYDRILFVEDEVTTGKTILNIVKLLKEVYPDMLFSVASILNGMNDEQLQDYKSKGIDVFWLYKIDNSEFGVLAERIKADGARASDTFDNECDLTNINRLYLDLDSRHITNMDRYNETIDILKYIVSDNIVGKPYNDTNVCVIGTEEFMYPAIRVGEHLVEKGYNVVCHSTTRSPIEVSSSNDAPLFSRMNIPSVYDEGRSTYIYNLKKYDYVIIITEDIINGDGIKSLIDSLKLVGNKDIIIYKIGVGKDEEQL